MSTTHLHLPRTHTPGLIDITPEPWWRRAGRAALALLILVMAVPLLWLLWLLGSLVALLLLGGAAALLGAVAVRGWWLTRAARHVGQMRTRARSCTGPGPAP